MFKAKKVQFKAAMTVQEKENRVVSTPPDLQVGDITVALAACQ